MSDKPSKTNQVLKRFFRSALALAVGGVVAKYQNDPRYLALSPLLQTLGKLIRVKYPNLEVPF